MSGTPSFISREYFWTFQGEVVSMSEERTAYIWEVASENKWVYFSNDGEGEYRLWMQDALVTHLGAKHPLSKFHIFMLQQISVAPTQLYPSSWTMIHKFESVCQYLELPISMKAFFYLFTISGPNGSRLHKVGYLLRLMWIEKYSIFTKNLIITSKRWSSRFAVFRVYPLLFDSGRRLEISMLLE